MDEITRPSRSLTAVFLLLAVTFIVSCTKSDVALVTQSTYGNRETTLGKAFGHYPFFLSRSWESYVDGNGQHIVMFTARVSTDRVFRAAAADAGKWLEVEQQYFSAVRPYVQTTYLRITFPIVSKGSYALGKFRLGISSGRKTAWSADFSRTEKLALMNAIHDGTPEIITILGRYANPSVREGSSLFSLLTGKHIKDF